LQAQQLKAQQKAKYRDRVKHTTTSPVATHNVEDPMKALTFDHTEMRRQFKRTSRDRGASMWKKVHNATKFLNMLKHTKSPQSSPESK